MVHTMELDPLIMGLCGETQISNKWASFTTMIQVYEYFISHKLGKAFESVFGGGKQAFSCLSCVLVQDWTINTRYI